jgi:hypothetical protein
LKRFDNDRGGSAKTEVFRPKTKGRRAGEEEVSPENEPFEIKFAPSGNRTRDLAPSS